MSQHQVVWEGMRFSMRDVNTPGSNNPCTLIRNVYMRYDGTLRKRRAFDGTPAGLAPTAHIMSDNQTESVMLVKDGVSVTVVTDPDTSGTTLTADPFWETGPAPLPFGAAATADDRGSFATHSGDVYYSDSGTTFVWPGRDASGARDYATVRRPGVPSLEGVVYNGIASAANEESLNLGFADNGAGAGTNGIADFHPVTGTVDLSATNPRYLFASDQYVDGQKILNTAFAFSWYDPSRDIYGKRSEPFALPYVFGPADNNDTNSFLTDLRTHYAKAITIPGHATLADYFGVNVPPDMKIAIWFSVGQRAIANPNATAVTGQFADIYAWTTGEWYPAMSQEMTETLFLEKIVAAQAAATPDIVCGKDDATLYQSGRYIDVFARPLPAKFLTILPGGTAIYFFPWRDIDDQTPQQLAEYSARHPEQIGRNTATQRETTSPVTISGVPVASVSDQATQLLITTRDIYRISFDGSVRLTSASRGRGLRGKNVFQSHVGTLWAADEGICWSRGGQIILLDKKIGIGDMYDALAVGGKEEVTIGVSEITNEIMIFMPNPYQEVTYNPRGHIAIVYNHETGFVSQYDTGTSAVVHYAAYFRGTDESKLMVWGAGWGNYPKGLAPHLDISNDALVEVWLTEQPHARKTMGDVIIDVPNATYLPNAGTAALDFDITVTAYDTMAPHNPIATAQDGDAGQPPLTGNTYTDSVSVTSTQTFGSNRRYITSNFNGMRGHAFRIILESAAASNAFAIRSLTAQYEVEDDDNAYSV